MDTLKKLSLTSWIMIGLLGGIAVGLILHWLLPEGLTAASITALEERIRSGNATATELDALRTLASEHWINFYLVDGLLKMGADIFIRTLKMLVVPLVFVSLVCGVSALGDPQKLGRIGGKTVLLYMVTTALAITVALLVANIAGVGQDASLTIQGQFSVNHSPPLTQVIVDIFPSNPIDAMAKGSMLQVIFFAVLFGLGISLAGNNAERIGVLFNQANEVIMKMVTVLMLFAPVGVFCVVTMVFAQQGLSPIVNLLHYFIVMVVILALHCFGVYSSMLSIIAKLSPLRFFENIRPAAMMAFSTASSNATLPITMETVEKHHGVHNSVASFTIPLGATINMDGTAIMQGVATVFIANAAGIDLSLHHYLLVILTATLASIGTAGVPGVGMITLAMVLRQVGLPEQGILLLLPVDRVLDMLRTTVNVCGDAVVTCIVAKSEGQFDQRIYDEKLGRGYGTVSFAKSK